MSTTYAPHAHLRRPHVDLRLGVIVGLVAALVALGSWVLVDRLATGGGGATQSATTLIDGVNTAFSTGNMNAIPSLYAGNAVMRTIGVGETYVGVTSIQALATGDFRAERIAPVTVNGEFASTFVRLSSGNETKLSISVFQIRDGKILRQWNFAPGETPPFDNSVPQ
jgi:hypothetical protein